MVVDTSALFAILGGEPEMRPFLEAMEAADAVRMSVVTWVETSMVIESRLGDRGARDLARLIERGAIRVESVDLEQGRMAWEAFLRFGRGRHRAALNLGDCFSYALAQTRGEALLCKGNDFVSTDVRVWGMKE
jgi:ribonuclease VapC